MLIQPKNPSQNDRFMMLKDALKEVEREEDFETIVNLTKPPLNILNIAPPMRFNNLKVGIIGGGVAGLSAAYELRKLGYNITIFEANPTRIGGRIYTHYFNTHHYGELGAMRIPVSHETTWHYIDLFNLKTNPFYVNSENNLLYVRKEQIKGLNIEEEIKRRIYPKFDLTNFEKKYLLSEHMSFIYNNNIQRMPKELRQEFYEIKKYYSHPINYYDYYNFRQTLSDIGFSESIVELFYSTLGIDRNLYYFNFLELLKEHYSVNYAYMYEIDGGLVNLPYAFINSFKVQNPNLGMVDFKQGSYVAEIYYRNNKVIIKHYTNQQFQFDEFDYVVCAIPFSKLRVLNVDPYFTNRKIQAIAEVNYIPAQKTVFFTKERFWEQSNQVILGGTAVTDLAINTMWYPSHVHDLHDPRSVLLASYNLNLDSTRVGNLETETGLYVVKRQLERVHGLPLMYLEDKILDFKSINWNKEELALGGFRWDRPEQNRLFSYAAATPEYDYHLFFAGEHVSQFHSWLQGSLQSGMNAANAIAQICVSRHW